MRDYCTNIYYALKIRTKSDLKVTVGKIRFDYQELRNMWGRKNCSSYSTLQVPLPDTQTPLVEYQRTRKNSIFSIQENRTSTTYNQWSCQLAYCGMRGKTFKTGIWWNVTGSSS